MKLFTRLILASVTVLIILVGWRAYRSTAPRIVGRAVAPDGTEMCVVQQFNWDTEPFTTSFIYRKSPGRWNRFYYDHQDFYWGQSPVVLDQASQSAVFYRGGVPAVTFAWGTGTYTMHRLGRVETAPGWRMPEDWMPTQSVYRR